MFMGMSILIMQQKNYRLQIIFRSIQSTNEKKIKNIKLTNMFVKYIQMYLKCNFYENKYDAVVAMEKKTTWYI